METLKAILKFFSGKKSVTATITMGVVAYLAAKGIFGEPEVALCTIIIGSIFGGASYATGRLVYPKNG